MAEARAHPAGEPGTPGWPVPELVEETPVRWRIEPRGAMRVPGVVFASRALLPEVVGDRSLEQVVNVATLPGIVVASYAMPDVHWQVGGRSTPPATVPGGRVRCPAAPRRRPLTT